MTIAKLPLPSVVVTTLIAAMIWFVAEGQTLREEQRTVPLAINGQETAEGRLLVRPQPDSDWNNEITLSLQGANAASQALLDEISPGLVLTAGVELPTSPGLHSVDVREALRRNEAFRGSGVSVVSVTPERLEIEVDRLESIEIDLVAAVDADLDTPPTVTPNSATLTGPSRILQRWLDSGHDSITVTLPPARLTGLTPGITNQVPNVAIELPEELRGAWATRIAPARVTIGVLLRSRTSSFTIRRLPVRVLVPPEAFGRFIVELPEESQSLQDVIFSGPQASITRIQEGELIPAAVIELTMEELELGVGSKPAKLMGLPTGVTHQVAQAILRVNVRRLSGIEPDPANSVSESPADGEDPPAGESDGADPG